MSEAEENNIEAPPEVAHKFTDTKGDEWEVALDVTAIKRARKELGIDLLNLDSGNLIARLMSDPIMLVDLIYVLCIDQAEERSISDTEFGGRMAGDAIADATEAMLGALVSFIPSPRDRATMKQVLDKTQEMMETARDHIEKEIKGGALDRIASEAAGKYSTSSPA